MQEVILKKLTEYDSDDFVYKYSVGFTDTEKKINARNEEYLLFQCSQNLKEHANSLDIGVSHSEDKLIAKKNDVFYEIVPSIPGNLFNALSNFSAWYRKQKSNYQPFKD